MQNQPKFNKANIRRNAVKRPRPKNLNLLTIRLPINALVSILHRATGFALFTILPLLLWLLQHSLSSAENFQQVMHGFDLTLVKLFLTLLAWAFCHHFFAGLRHLAMDVHWMTSLMKARLTSRWVLVVGLLATMILAIKVIW